MTSGEKIVIVCPVQDWSVFFAIGACRIMRERGFDVSVMPKSMAQENIFSNDIDINICDGSSINGKMMFLAPDPIAERDARVRGIETMGCVADEYDPAWSEISSCWNGQSDSSLFSAYENAFGKPFYMEMMDSQKISKPYAGVAIKSESVRMLVKSAFFVQNLRLWHVPIRQNVMKRLHESCSCATLITDDPFCAIASFAHGNSVILLRKPCDGLPNLSNGLRLVEQNIAEYSS